MAKETGIAWTDSTWNPLRGTEGRWFCTKVDELCHNCYAERMNIRFGGPKFTQNADQIRLDEDALALPFSWEGRKIFVCSMSDLFHESVPFAWIDRIFGVMHLLQRHTFQVLTKRAERMAAYLSDPATPNRIFQAADAISVARRALQIRQEVRPIAGYPGYFVSNAGTVYSTTGSGICLYCGVVIDRKGKQRYCSQRCRWNADYERRTGKPPRYSPTLKAMSPERQKKGHLRVTLRNDQGIKKEELHRIVLSVFDRPPIGDEQGRHLNGDPTNNHIANLVWGTQEENWSDRNRHGNGRSYSKLTHAQVESIRNRATIGETVASLADAFGISDTQIRNVVAQKQWATTKGWPLRNCWHGVSVGTRAGLRRLAFLRRVPSTVRWVSLEPLLEDLGAFDLSGANWYVAGGESGAGARRTELNWFRTILTRCHDSGIPFFMKQTGEVLARELGCKDRAGKKPEEWPADLRIQEFPALA